MKYQLIGSYERRVIILFDVTIETIETNINAILKDTLKGVKD